MFTDPLSRSVWLTIGLAIGAVGSVSAGPSAAEQQVMDGNYGRVGEFRNWTVVLESAQWAQSFRMTVQLRDDGLRVKPIEGVMANGVREPYNSEIEWILPAYRTGDSGVRFEIPIVRLPKPKLGEATGQPAHTQIVSVQFVVAGNDIVAKAVPADAGRCPNCVAWTVAQFSHSR